MKKPPEMKLVPRRDLPSIWVDEISGLEFTDHGRDAIHPYQEWRCMKFRLIVCEARAKMIGVSKTTSGGNTTICGPRDSSF